MLRMIFSRSCVGDSQPGLSIPDMTRIMLQCIKIKEIFCAVHDGNPGRLHGNLAHGLNGEGAYRAVTIPLGLIQS
jgi:hypothetical protein